MNARSGVHATNCDDFSPTLTSFFESQCEEHPRRTAIFDGRAEVSYSDLAARANSIAAELTSRGIQPGSLVAVCMGRDWEMVATLLGVLRAGCAYVPLDPEYPNARLSLMLKHSGAVAVIVDDSHQATEICAEGPVEQIRRSDIPTQGPGDSPRPSPTDLAYVIYTSGSTGHPKGVAVEHRSVVAMTNAMSELLSDEELSGVLAGTSACFDPSVMEILGTLSLGGTVILADNVLALPTHPAAERVRTVITVPSAMQALIATGGLPAGVRCVALGGEVFKTSLAQGLHARRPAPRVINLYGPTESAVFATACEVSAGAERITIGTPVHTVRAYILNESMEPVPAGTAGELYLAGDQLAREYLRDPERTRERFVTPPPEGSVPEDRLYRTGDLCKWTDAHEIDFLGRADLQVKIRGFRIELEEVESALESIQGIVGAAVTVFEDSQRKAMLVGYFVGRDEIVTDELVRGHLRNRIPGHMIPQLLVSVDELPVSPSGKLDRRRLPDPALLPNRRRSQLVSIVRSEVARFLKLPGAEDVPLDEQLGHLGLDSLDALEVGHRLAQTLEHPLPAEIALDRSTVQSVVDQLLDAGGDGASGREPTGRPSPTPLRNTLGHFQSELQTGYPPFMAAKASAWSASDKGGLIRELENLLGGEGLNPYGRLVRTGSAHRGVVADVHTGEERECIIWTTNLYLGLNRDPQVIKEATNALQRLGAGMGTSSAASGRTDIHLAFESEFAELVGKPSACLFPTGFTSSMGAITGILGDDDLVVMDQLCHASIVDGARLCGATTRTFKHNDAADLESVLRAEVSPHRTTMVVLESVYSMGEGTAPLRDIVHTAKRYGALVMVDEAHSFGFYGPQGAGLCAAMGVTDDVDFITTPLSKALGSIGGVVATSEEHATLLRTSARSYVFQAACTPADIAASLAALRRVRTDGSLRERLWATTAYMRARFTEAGYDLGTGDGPVVAPLFSDSDTLYATTRGLFTRGIHTAAVTYPIVERGQGRMRFICSAAHTRDDVDATIAALVEAELEQSLRTEPSLGRQAPFDDTSSPPRCLELQAWAASFGEHLDRSLRTVAGPTPSVYVSIDLSDGDPPIAIHVHDRVVTLDSDAPEDVPSCFIRARDDRTLSALCEHDVRTLLECTLEGTCTLHGQTEAFVWFIARMAAAATRSSAYTAAVQGIGVS